MPSIILASSSHTRIKILENADIKFVVQPAKIDERSIVLKENMSFDDYALTLARKKASVISSQNLEDVVIGGDQILIFDGHIIHKSENLSALKSMLLSMRGKEHQLISAISIYQSSNEVFYHIDNAQLMMRNYSEAFIDKYIRQEGKKLLSSVGGYFYETSGCQLFEKVSGDYYTILGFPILPILAFLREKGLIEIE